MKCIALVFSGETVGIEQHHAVTGDTILPAVKAVLVPYLYQLLQYW